MNLKSLLLFASCLLATACGAMSEPKKIKKTEEEKPAIRLTLIPTGELASGKSTPSQAKLLDLESMTVLTQTDLAQFRLLLADATLTDLQLITPTQTATPGLYSFTFTPKLPGGYRAWADVKTITGKQQFASADLGRPRASAINTLESREAAQGDYRFTLTHDNGANTARILVATKSGSPVTSLESGTIFTIANFRSIASPPVTVQGPELTFPLVPQPGHLKLLAQIKIAGRDYLIPFTLKF